MATANNLKLLNMENARAFLKSGKPYTKNSLAAASGLSVATCGNILKELLTSGEVTETSMADSTGGRPSRQFEYNDDFSYVLALYARKERSIESIYYSISNLVGHQVYEHSTTFNQITIEDIDSMVKNALDLYPKITSISIGIAGVVHGGKTGVCDFERLCDLDIKSYFESKYSFKITVLNDVNSCALGYYSKQKLNENKDIVYLYYPDGGNPGAGIIINGQVLSGSSNFAGEVAYLPHRRLDDKGFAADVLQTIMAINCIVNPQTIVLSGYQFNNANINEIKQNAQSCIPNEHMPGIVFEQDMHYSYTHGLTSIALEQLAYRLEER